jgi:hypothetical protein
MGKELKIETTTTVTHRRPARLANVDLHAVSVGKRIIPLQRVKESIRRIGDRDFLPPGEGIRCDEVCLLGDL